MSIKEFYSKYDTQDGFGSTAGNRTNPHRGGDVVWAEGTPIPALTPGTVITSEWHKVLGWIVEVRDAFGIYVGYRHMRSQGLRVGSTVAQGQIVGFVGSTGTASTGPHVCITCASGAGGVFGVVGLVFDPYPYILKHSTDAPTGQKADGNMARNTGIYWKSESQPNTFIYATFNAESGFWADFSNGSGHGPMPSDYNNALAGAMDTPSWAKVTESHANVIRAACAQVRPIK